MIRAEREARWQRLRAVSLFAGTTDDELRRIERVTTEIAVAPGQVLCREGGVGRQAFVILTGEAVVTLAGSEIARVGPGSVVGEMAVLDGSLRTATVTGVTPLLVLAMSGSELEQLLEQVPRVTRRILAALSGRLRLADRAVADRPRQELTIQEGAAR
jgi:CRP-like cAMP-binding protein